MSNQKYHQSMRNLRRVYDAVLQSSTKGTTAVEVSKKIGMHKTMVHRNLNTLELMGKVENKHGIWRVKAKEQTKASEKQILIELPMPKNQWRQIATLEAQVGELERVGFHEVAKSARIFLERFRETRTIKITGKNVDDLDLEKATRLIQEANKKTSMVNLKGFLKRLTKSSTSNSRKA